MSDVDQDQGVPASPSGCQPSASAAVPASSQSGIPNAERFYIDCEFDGHDGPLLSIAMVAENGLSIHLHPEHPSGRDNAKEPQRYVIARLHGPHPFP